jgi:sec-independent protein translocase protein TatB
MEILGIGPSELIFILIIALIILGPKDMQKTGKMVGRWLNGLVRSDGYKAFQHTSREIRNLPNKLMRDANLEMLETENELRKVMADKPKPPASTPPRYMPVPQEAENSIQPPPPPDRPTEDTTRSDETIP